MSRRKFRLSAARTSGWAWAAVGMTALFFGITCWWVTRDRGVPFADAASHLFTIVTYRDRIADHGFAGMWHPSDYYPPLTFLEGALSLFVGGLHAGVPVIGQNLLYVPLFALGCYRGARLIAGPQAGFLAVVFALGSPLLIEQFHVFMIDAPEAALVALTLWLLLESERFERVGYAALAGVAVGAGMESKEQFALFVPGLLLVAIVRGGWRNWRGLLMFAALALLIGIPWYYANRMHLHQILEAASSARIPPRGRPPLLSISNLGWYGWALLNGVLFAPLGLFAAVGVGRAVVLVVRRRAVARIGSRDDLLPELLAGLFVGWLGISLTPHHDMRYAIPLLGYLAILGTVWVPPLRRSVRLAATGTLIVATVLTTLGMSFGIGPDVRVLLGRRIVTDVSWGIPAPDQIVVYSNHDFTVSAPRRGDDVLRLFKAMRRDGITGVAWPADEAPVGEPIFDTQGVTLFARFAGLQAPELGGTPVATRPPPPGFRAMTADHHWLRAWWDVADPRNVLLTRHAIAAGERPCVRLRDGSGLWLRRGDGTGIGPTPYCPV